MEIEIVAKQNMGSRVRHSPGGMIRPYHSKLAVLYRIFDGAWIAGSLWILCWLYQGQWQINYSIVAAWAIGFFYLFAEGCDLYRSWRSASLRQEVVKVWFAWLGVLMGLLFLAYITKTSAQYSRRIILSWFTIAPLALNIWRIGVRLFLREMRKRGYNTRTVAIAGAGDLGSHLAHKILEARWMGLRLIGFYDDKKPVGYRPLSTESVQVKGNLEDLCNHARMEKIDLLYIALPMRAVDRMKELLNNLADTTTSVYIIPDIFIFDLLHARWTNLGGIPAISIFESPFYEVDGWIKRLEDLILGSLILLLVSIPMLIIAIGVKLSSPGPVIFRQRRYGLDGREIVVWKFRTMTVCEDGPYVPQAKRGDSRVTRFGAFLRRTSLDELPQFINVLQGRMSIVGPRPHAVAHNEQYRQIIYGYMLRHKVKPGITGLAQVNGWRGETDTLEKMQKRVEYDLEYIRNWSLGLDLKIILLTIFKGFTGKNAF